MASRFRGGDDTGTGVDRLVGWILAGSLLTAALAWVAIEIGGVAAPRQVALGLGAAVGGGLGAVGYLVAAGEESAEAGVEEVAVDMDDGGADAPATGDDLFAAHPDPTLYFATENGSLVARAVNPAFEERFGASATTLSGTPLSEALMTDDDAALVERLERGEAFDERVACETVDGRATGRLRAVLLDGEGTDGYLLYSDLELDGE